jgi:iron complex outermembrane receptor protein
VVQAVDRRRVLLLFAAIWIFLAAAPAGANPESLVRFDIPPQRLSDALHGFSEQSGLQIVYDATTLAKRQAPAVSGAMPVSEALDRLLAGSDLVWSRLNEGTIVIGKLASRAAKKPSSQQRPPTARSDEVTSLSTLEVWADPLRVLPTEASAAAFGFDKSLLETPRSVSVISEQTIDLFGLSAVEDLVAVVPGVFTTTRFGIQGAVDVRNVPADTYFRGMKRLTLQGHGRSVLAAMDTIEVVGGPASPIYGMGKLGGYTNLVPKSGRARTGQYLDDTQGFVQAIGGRYNRREVSFGLGGPLRALEKLDRRGGYYLYGLIEDSESFALGVPIKQGVFQIATSVDEFFGPFRLETGANYQVSRTAGALTGRFTQDLADTGRYIRGTPLVDLDANANGAIGFLEMHNGSPTQGALSNNNQPLMQSWAWPRSESGEPLPIEEFPRTPGIPLSLHEYLALHPEADPTGLLFAQGPGGPQPISGHVPIGMVLDPRTVGFDDLNFRRAAAFERDLRAEFVTAFLDLIYDTDPDLTVKNQFFFDGMDQYKNSNQPFVQEQDVYAVEDKLTITRRIGGLPTWLRINSLGSLNARKTVSEGRTSGTGDFSNSRSDAMASTWIDELGGMTPNSTFASPIDNPDLSEDGYPWVNDYRTEFSEFGLGVLFDIDLMDNTNLVIGGRFDRSEAKNVDYAGAFDPVLGTSQNPGQFSVSDVRARGWDGGVSWSASWSYALPYGLRPYATWGRSTIMLDGNNNAMSNEVIEAGHVGKAKYREIGLKGSLLNDRLFFSIASFRQARTGVSADDENALIFAYATATDTHGTSVEVKWVPLRNMLLSVYAIHEETEFDPNVGSMQIVDARTLGFEDIVDAQGDVIFPAEAFLYGGRARIQLPANMPQYKKKQGNPDTQLGLSASYRAQNGLGCATSANYFSSTCSGRLCTVRLPEALVVNAGIFYELGRWSAKLDVQNLFNERYFRARTGDTLGNVLAQAMPDRRWQVTVEAKF